MTTKNKQPIIFIIEDHKDVAFMFETAFEDVGFEVVHLNDGQKAMERLAEQIPNVALLDLNLPYVSGEDVIDMMRTDERYKNVYTVLSSSNYIRSDVVGQKFDHVLEKPFVYARLKEFATLLYNEIIQRNS